MARDGMSSCIYEVINRMDPRVREGSKAPARAQGQGGGSAVGWSGPEHPG